MVCKKKVLRTESLEGRVTCSAMHNSQCGLVHSKAGCFQQEFSVRNQRILYEMVFTVVSYSIVGVCTLEGVLVYKTKLRARLVHLKGYSGTGKGCDNVYGRSLRQAQ